MQETKQFYKNGEQNSSLKTYKGLLIQEYWHIPDTKAEFIIVPESSETSSFRDFIASQKLLHFLRTTLDFIEDLQGFHDYHSCIHPRAFFLESVSLKQTIWPDDSIMESAKIFGWYLFIVGDKRKSCIHIPDAIATLGMDSPLDYTDREGAVVKLSLTNRDLCIEENKRTRCYLDAKGRPMYVVVMKYHVRKQSDLSDSELLAFWRTVVLVLDRHHPTEGGSDVFESMRLNCGGFQNVAHLHLKILMRHTDFEDAWGMNKTYQTLKLETQPKHKKRRCSGSFWCCVSPNII